MTNWRAKLLSTAPDLKQETVDYPGHQIHATTSGIVRLFTVRDGQWFFFANDPEQLKPLLDRVDGRVKDPETALAADEVFAAASKHMPASYAGLAFARIDQLVEKLMPSATDEPVESAGQLAAIRKIRSLCAATTFDGGKIRDTIFVGMPKLLDSGRSDPRVARNWAKGNIPLCRRLPEFDESRAPSEFAGRLGLDGWFAEDHSALVVEWRNP